MEANKKRSEAMKGNKNALGNTNNKGRCWYTNLIEDKMIKPGEVVPPGFIKGKRTKNLRNYRRDIVLVSIQT